MSILASTFAPLSNWSMNLSFTRWLLEKTMGFDRRRSFPAFQRGSFIKKANDCLRHAGPDTDPVDKVVYFADSYARYNDHDLGLTTIKVLRRLGVHVVVPDQRPAPMPAYVYGNLRRARKDMKYNLRQLWPYVRQGYKIICSEPSAAMFLKDELPLLIDSEAAHAVAAAAVELMEYLNAFPQTTNYELRTKNYKLRTISYHAPCHLKSLNGAKNTIELFAKLGIVVNDLNGGCCGLAGTSGMQKKNRDLCDAIGLPLRQTIKNADPGCILTECAACKMQIEHLAGKPVIHPVMLLAQNLLDSADNIR
jgi:Fe-S oxidoreductase